MVKKNVHNDMWWQKNIIHFNIDSIIKNLPFNLKVKGSERRWKVQTYTFTPYVGGLGVYMNKVFSEGS